MRASPCIRELRKLTQIPSSMFINIFQNSYLPVDFILWLYNFYTLSMFVPFFNNFTNPSLLILSSLAIRGVIVHATSSKNNCGPICNFVFSCWKTPFFSKRFVREEKWNCTSHSKKLYSLAVRSKEIYVSPTFCNNLSTEKHTGCTFLVCTMPEIKNVRIPSLSKTIHYLYNTLVCQIDL